MVYLGGYWADSGGGVQIPSTRVLGAEGFRNETFPNLF